MKEKKARKREGKEKGGQKEEKRKNTYSTHRRIPRQLDNPVKSTFKPHRTVLDQLHRYLSRIFFLQPGSDKLIFAGIQLLSCDIDLFSQSISCQIPSKEAGFLGVVDGVFAVTEGGAVG